MSWKDVGYIEGEFDNPLRKARMTGLIITPKLTLKGYDMYTKEPSTNKTINKMEQFLIKEIEQNKIDPKIGFGFVILSKDMLNISRWDNEYPIVIVNSLYQFSEESKNIHEAEKLSVDEFGPYCLWELGIVNHERKAWLKYLNSARQKKDKINYLHSQIEGRLD